MKKLFVFLMIGFCILNLGPVRAEDVSPQLLPAVDKIYNNDFAGARALIDRHIQSHPDDPAGYLLRGISNEWYQLLRNQGGMNRLIMDDYQKARRLAQDAVDKDRDDIQKKAMLATVLIYVAKKNLDMNNKAQSGFHLKKAKNLMEEVIKTDPNNATAYFAIGLFNYFADRVPPGFRWLASLLGFRGNAAKGLRYIQKAAQVKSLTQGDAQYMLVYIYQIREKQYARALKWAQKLNKRYPQNQVFLYHLAENEFRTKKVAASRQTYQKFFDFCEKHAGWCSQKYLYLANFHMAWGYMDEKNYTAARKYVLNSRDLNTHKYKDKTAQLNEWLKMLEIGDE